MENSDDNAIVFLDTKITSRHQEIQIQYQIKPTNTGIYMPFSAYAPKRQKIASIRTLHYRAFRICSSMALYKEVADQIETIFLTNSFPAS